MKLSALFVNGRFRTLDPSYPIAHTIGVRDGRIVGLDDHVVDLPTSQTIDLEDQWAVPGFNDVHRHISIHGERLGTVDLGPTQCATPTDALVALRTAVDRLQPGEWVLATGYDQVVLGRYPTRAELDAVSSRHPIWMLQASGHLGVANTRALRLAGIDPDAPPMSIAGGLVEHAADGTASGVLSEGAMSVVAALIKPLSREQMLANIGLGAAAALAEGVTSFTEPGVVGPGLSGNGPDDLGVFQEARESGIMPLRATLFPESGSLYDPETGRFGYGGLRTGFGDHFLRLGAVKFYLDGSLLGQTAAVSEPFAGNGTNGIFQADPRELEHQLIAAHRAGWQVAVHAIGDRGVGLALGAFERAQRETPRVDPRHLIEHAAVTTPSQVERMADAAIIPVPQSTMPVAFGHAIRAALGEERLPMVYRQASFLRAGITIPGSSDTPVAPSAPLAGIHDLVNREVEPGFVIAPEERLTIDEALHAYTVGSAFSNHEERYKGRLSPGMLADFTVLDRDLLSSDPKEIETIRVKRTIVAGAVRYAR